MSNNKAQDLAPNQPTLPNSGLFLFQVKQVTTEWALHGGLGLDFTDTKVFSYHTKSSPFIMAEAPCPAPDVWVSLGYKNAVIPSRGCLVAHVEAKARQPKCRCSVIPEFMGMGSGTGCFPVMVPDTKLCYRHHHSLVHCKNNKLGLKWLGIRCYIIVFLSTHPGHGQGWHHSCKTIWLISTTWFSLNPRFYNHHQKID